jgi:O-antigen ligase
MSAETTLYHDPAAATVNEITALHRNSEIAQALTNSVEQYILVGGLSALLIFGVLAFGGTEQWTIVTMEAGCALMFLYWIWSRISAEQLQLRLNRLYAPVVLFGLIIIVQVVFGLSAYVHATRVELWKYAAYGSLFLIANHFQGTTVNRLLTILATFGFMLAFFALVQYLAYDGKIYWVWPGLPTSFGPYVDHSHYAGLMEMLTPIPFAIALTHGVKRYEQVLWTAGGMLMAATIFLSGSRGGMTAFAVQMVLFAGLVLSRTSRRMFLPVLAIVVVIGAFVLWVDDGRVLKQVASFRDPLTNSAVISRFDIAKDLPRMVRDRPMIGWGLGVFPIVYPQYRRFSTDLVVNQAHNDYLQVLVETGVLGFGCVIWFIVNLYRSAMRNFRANFGLATSRALAPIVGCTGILIHSLSDFNLHIPANAAMFFVLCGIAAERQHTGAKTKTPRVTFA